MLVKNVRYRIAAIIILFLMRLIILKLNVHVIMVMFCLQKGEMRMDIINFMYLDDTAISNLYGQIRPNAQQITESINHQKTNNFDGEIGVANLPFINPNIGYHNLSTSEKTIERSIVISIDQKTIELIRFILEEKHVSPFEYYVNTGIIRNSKIIVFEVELCLSSIRDKAGNIYDFSDRQATKTFFVDNQDSPLILNDRDSQFNDMYRDYILTKDIRETTYCFESPKFDVQGYVRRYRSHLRGDQAVDRLAYTLKMNLGGQNFRMHFRHLTYLAYPGASFNFNVFGEVVNTGDKNYIVKPFAVWR